MSHLLSRVSLSAPQGVAGRLGKDFARGARSKVDEFKFGLAENAKMVLTACASR